MVRLPVLMAIHEWASLSWPAFRALSPARPVAILPLGALEAHGPHLPLGTDVIIADAMARAGAARLSRRGIEVVLLPPLAVAPAPFAAAFAGTIDTPAAAATASIAGVAVSAARHGIRATVIANAHHDPAHVAAIRDAVAVAAAHGATILFPDLTRRRWAARLTEEFQSGACHAGRYEGSIVMAVAGPLVDVERMRALPPNPHSLVDAIRRGDTTFDAAGGAEAYFGWPGDASADEGRRIIGQLGAIIEDVVREHAESEGVTMSEPAAAAAATDIATSTIALVNPPGLGPPRGFSHGVLVPPGWATVAVAGQTAADAGDVAAMPFLEQFDRALAKIVDVVRASGTTPQHVIRMTVFVTDLDAYQASRPALAAVWRRHMGRHYPAMTLVEVRRLVDGAIVEIQADAVVPPPDRP
jgi:creatinine amidohydrolase